jgi:hypothetical protein
VVAWYDNEWGYSNKVLEMVQVVSPLNATRQALYAGCDPAPAFRAEPHWIAIGDRGARACAGAASWPLVVAVALVAGSGGLDGPAAAALAVARPRRPSAVRGRPMASCDRDRRDARRAWRAHPLRAGAQSADEREVAQRQSRTRMGRRAGVACAVGRTVVAARAHVLTARRR